MLWVVGQQAVGDCRKMNMTGDGLVDLDDFQAYVAELDRIATTVDLSWVYVEAPDLVPELPGPDRTDPPHQTTVTLVRWRGGVRTVQPLAACHPHGFWIHWQRDAGTG